MRKVLLVCTGNICRSPMAEGFLKKMRSDFTVSSAGVSAVVGWGPSSEAIEIMEEYGVDISDHVARQVEGKLMEEADLVLTMERFQKEKLRGDFPEADGKIFTLKEYAGTGIDIQDPYGMPKEFYQLIAQEIETALKKADFGRLK